MSKNRNAVLIAGFARDYEKYIDNFKENIITSDNVDVFGCFWNYVGTRSFEKHESITKTTGQKLTICNDKKEVKLLDLQKIKKDYNAKDIKIHDLDFVTSVIKPQSEIIEISDLVPKGLKFEYHITRLSLTFFMLREVFLLMEQYEKKNNIVYKNIAKARTDLVRDCVYPKIDWSKDFGDAIYVANHPWSGTGMFSINDHFGIGKREVMSNYFKFYDNMHIPAKKFKTNEYNSTDSIKNPTRTKAWSPEHSLSIYLYSLGIKWKPIRKLKK